MSNFMPFNFVIEILTVFRYQKYADLACKGIITPEKLPPTEKAAHYHGLRCHYQLIQWSMINDFNIQPSEWGWKLENGVLAPVMTDEEIAPQSLIKVIRCRCKVKYNIIYPKLFTFPWVYKVFNWLNYHISIKREFMNLIFFSF